MRIKTSSFKWIHLNTLMQAYDTLSHRAHFHNHIIRYIALSPGAAVGATRTKHCSLWLLCIHWYNTSGTGILIAFILLYMHRHNMANSEFICRNIPGLAEEYVNGDLYALLEVWWIDWSKSLLTVDTGSRIIGPRWEVRKNGSFVWPAYRKMWRQTKNLWPGWSLKRYKIWKAGGE